MISKVVKIGIRAFLILIAILLSGSTVYSQISPRGIKAGLSYTTINGSSFECGRKFGLSAGLMFSHEFNEAFMLQPEALFIMKGAKFYGWNSDPDRIDATVSADYLEFPILMAYRYKWRKGPVIKIYSGPAFAFRLTAKVAYHDSGNTVDLDRFARSIDLGIAMGTEIGFEFKNVLYSLDARLTPGLVNQNNTSSSIDVKNNVVLISLGMLF